MAGREWLGAAAQVTWRAPIGGGEVAAAVDMSGDGMDMSGGARRKRTRVSSANFGEGHIFIGRGS